MSGPRRRRWRLSTRILFFQLLLLIVTSALALGLVVHAVSGSLDHEAELRALAIAHSVAAIPEVYDAVQDHNMSGVVQRQAMAIDRAAGASFVVVTDDHGIRYSHPNPAMIGKRVSTSPDAALHGKTVMAVQTGTLGRSARAKVPLRSSNGRIVGEVSVGILVSRLNRSLIHLLPEILAYWALLLAIGLVGSVLLARWLKRETYGLELGTVADLFREREAVLRDIREGVIAVDENGLIRVVNDEAQSLLGLIGDAVGKPVESVALAPELMTLLRSRRARSDVVVLQSHRVLVASIRPVRLQGRALGAVVTIRDRTELEELSRELSGVRNLAETLRSSSHEFANRLHVIAGLLQLGLPEKALGFIDEISQIDADFSAIVDQRVASPLLRALLVSKFAVAGEHGVELRVDENCAVGGEILDPEAALTVIGNLIDNALDAAGDAQTADPWVLVLLREHADTLEVRVSDSGPGVPEDERANVLELGHTTKSRVGVGTRGIGLALVARLVQERSGSLTIGADPGGGAMFEVTLPGIVGVATAAS